MDAPYPHRHATARHEPTQVSDTLVSWMPFLSGCTATEQAALADAARRHGIGLDTLAAGLPRPILQDTLVVAFGEEAEDAASWYAYLTGRSLKRARTVMALLALDCVDVVICALEDLTPELFEVLHVLSPHRMPGLLFAPRHALALRCSISAICAHRALRAEGLAAIGGGQVSLFPRGNGAEATDHADPKSSTVIRRVVESAHGTLVLQTHCDGMDAKISDDLALCSRLDASHTDQPCGARARCHSCAWCHRFDRDLADPSLAARLIRPSAIHASILLFDACWGIYPPAGVDPAFAIGSQLAQNPRISAILAPYRLGFSRQDLIAGLVKDIASGLALGEAVARHHRSAAAQSLDHALCLFGDPRTRVTPDPSPPPLASVTFQTAPPIAAATTRIDDAHVGTDGERAMAKRLVEWRDARQPTTVEPSGDPIGDSSPDRAFTSRLAAALSETVPRTDFAWLTASSVIRTSVSTHACLAETSIDGRWATYEVRLDESARAARRLSLCQRCGIAEDVDPRLPLRVERLSASEVALHMPESLRVDYAFVSLCGQARSERRIFDLDRLRATSISVDLASPDKLVGISYLSIVVIVGLRFSIFQYLIDPEALATFTVTRMSLASPGLA